MTNPVINNQTYIDARDALLRKNEGFSTTVYFDTNGIPTIGVGVALLTSKGAINLENMKTIATALGANSIEYKQLYDFAKRASDVILGTPSMGVAHNVSEFIATERGQAIVDEFGKIHFNNGFVVNDGALAVTNDAASKISTAAANARENQLDGIIVGWSDGDPGVLTIGERAVLFDVLYQNGSGSAKLRSSKIMHEKKTHSQDQHTCQKCGELMELREVGFFKIYEAVFLYLVGVLIVGADFWVSFIAKSAHGSGGNGRGLIWVPVFIGVIFFKVKQNTLKKVWACADCKVEEKS